jgi:hypothetical protein
MRITKAEAIRAVAHEDISLSNKQIKAEVQRRFGYVVESNQIINVLGAYSSRRYGGAYGQHQLKLAREYVQKIGDLRQAVQLIHLSQQ